MARTHKTASIKAQMAEQARKEEEARQQMAAARTRSQKSAALARARESRADVEEEVGADEDAEEEEGEEAEEGEDAEEEEGEADEEEGDAMEEEVSTTRTSRRSGRGGAEAKWGRRHGKKRSVSDVEDEELVQVPAFETQHASWASLEVSLQEYMEATRQKIVIKEVINVGRRNADLRKQIRFQGCQDSEIPLVPESWEPYQRKYIYTHGWSARERSTGKRVSHKLLTTECPFQMIAQVCKRPDGVWRIVMKREVYQHNHRISDDIYRSHPGIRQVPAESPLMPGIEMLVEAEAGTSSVYNYIRENSNHRVTMDDVRNLIGRMRKRGQFSMK
ncbi:hypothetical protein PF005_g27198 [Phytophthora fragariae]|uniref:FAR1 domain-containing protein n=3 Tax=Phytophthora fragariae TaxID=53985 RepID=A0A6A3R1Q8_9STRA|nr:hypothetical protein PF003_g24519 [Phytophthora fragariae]KAE8929131.1 hypothetical protein PF009_g20745 [Phytophthora fragariae]KAE8976941.1 hypothetical protein PF011_g23851 [Phytophthora fragariae]KAE9083194.1 hypothetical protein PF006_g26739 [Phytophthora fragariae]KAE9088045.1 hypothetical protein PF007_g20130 [Phytophthora fragariae]